MANAGSIWSLSFELLLVLSPGNEFEPGINQFTVWEQWYGIFCVGLTENVVLYKMGAECWIQIPRTAWFKFLTHGKEPLEFALRGTIVIHVRR
jgi:hypothetical protein